MQFSWPWLMIWRRIDFELTPNWLQRSGGIPHQCGLWHHHSLQRTMCEVNRTRHGSWWFRQTSVADFCWFEGPNGDVERSFKRWHHMAFPDECYECEDEIGWNHEFINWLHKNNVQQRHQEMAHAAHVTHAQLNFNASSSALIRANQQSLDRREKIDSWGRICSKLGVCL